MWPSSQTDPSHIGFLIFTICAFIHLQLVASDINTLCAKTRFTDHCKELLASDPRNREVQGSSLVDDIHISRVVLDMVLSTATRARDKANSIIGEEDIYDVERLKKCMANYDEIAAQMKVASQAWIGWQEDITRNTTNSGKGALAACDKTLLEGGSYVKNELDADNKRIDKLLDIFLTVLDLYDAF